MSGGIVWRHIARLVSLERGQRGVQSAVRARAGIDYVLNDVLAALGNCCLLRGELEAMTAEFLDVPRRVIAKAIDAEIESGNLV